MTTANPYAPPMAEVADVDESAVAGAAPPLWNPGAAASWSLFFTPVFGAAVQMKNWQALGEPDKAKSSKAWLVVSLVFMALMAALGGLLPESKAIDGVSRALGLALLVTWYYANGKSQMNYVKARFGKTYERRGWGKPLGWAVLGWIGFLVAAVAIGFVIGFVRAMIRGSL